MKKTVLIFLMCVMSVVGYADVRVGFVAELGVAEQINLSSVHVTVKGSAIHVKGAMGKVLEIVSLTGKRIANIKIDSDSQHVELNIPKGCYILKVGNVVRKVSIG